MNSKPLTWVIEGRQMNSEPLTRVVEFQQITYDIFVFEIVNWETYTLDYRIKLYSIELLCF